jgi:cell division cycle 20-like protein 1 (cofactor of APC complex)
MGDENAGCMNGEASLAADDENSIAYSRLLRRELLGDDGQALGKAGGILRYKSAAAKAAEGFGGDDLFRTGPLRSERGPEAVKPKTRKVPPEPYRVLHAPLEDDFYLNPLDCSTENVLAVALGSSIHLWSARTSSASTLCCLGGGHASIASVRWAPVSNLLAVGTKGGEVQLWDATRRCKVAGWSGHQGRVSALAWISGDSLLTGGQDHEILRWDLRQAAPWASRLQGHSQEVCGMQWSQSSQQLASGGNEGSVCVWSMRSPAPEMKFCEHEAGVKALAWSPHRRGLLASGGGTADKCIRTWNTLSGAALSNVYTSSQVCNLAWSEGADEIVSTHGYSGNEVVLWRHPSMTRLAALTGHGARVLYMAASPDGRTIITGAADQRLCFWSVFRGLRSRPGMELSRQAPCLAMTIR